MDKDGDNIPDALEGLTEKAKALASQAEEKAKSFWRVLYGGPRSVDFVDLRR